VLILSSLDYAKLNNSIKLQRLTIRGEDRQKGFLQKFKTTSFDLSNLVEGVVEGIFAGHNYRGMTTADKGSPEQARMFREHKTVRLTPPSMNPNVMIILDIERHSNWLLESQIGAWKRILTNLFGNALKYTEAGFVRVSLHAVAVRSQRKSSTVTLEIEDSGIGMTQDYLKHRLYTPFAQANPMSVGTGLGLSIVRQLVNDLGGNIHFESEINCGTSIKVSVPFNMSLSDQPDEQSIESSATIRDIKVWCKGLKLCLIGFDYYPEIEEAPTGILSAHARRMLLIRSSVLDLAAEWFGMEVVLLLRLRKQRVIS
jgi:signal transduction histidine kinase